jgi:hypothetical protein
MVFAGAGHLGQACSITRRKEFEVPESTTAGERHGNDDALLAELAAAAVDALDRRIRAGDDPVEAVGIVLDKTFRAEGPESGERITLLLADEPAMSRITKAVLDILGIDPRE